MTDFSFSSTAEDVTDIVHPDVAARAIDAARIVGLDTKAIDVERASVFNTRTDVGRRGKDAKGLFTSTPKPASACSGL